MTLEQDWFTTKWKTVYNLYDQYLQHIRPGYTSKYTDQEPLPKKQFIEQWNRLQQNHLDFWSSPERRHDAEKHMLPARFLNESMGEAEIDEIYTKVVDETIAYVDAHKIQVSGIFLAFTS